MKTLRVSPVSTHSIDQEHLVGAWKLHDALYTTSGNTPEPQKPEQLAPQQLQKAVDNPSKGMLTFLARFAAQRRGNVMVEITPGLTPRAFRRLALGVSAPYAKAASSPDIAPTYGSAAVVAPPVISSLIGGRKQALNQREKFMRQSYSAWNTRIDTAGMIRPLASA